jgi:hypothetical protein
MTLSGGIIVTLRWGMDVAPDKQIGQWGILVSASSGKSLCEKENGAAKIRSNGLYAPC